MGDNLRSDFVKLIRKMPIIRDLAMASYRIFKQFPGSETYWIDRYKKGGHSGPGSYNKLAEFKAEIINEFVKTNEIKSIIEYGCGDGNQLKLADYPNYLGFDVSRDVISTCKYLFNSDHTKRFKLMGEYDGEHAELTLSLDVIYHLVEDDVFDKYMRILFDSSDRFVIIYSSNKCLKFSLEVPHIKHRKFTEWINENLFGWELICHIPNKYPYRGDITIGSFSEFYIFKKEI